MTLKDNRVYQLKLDQSKKTKFGYLADNINLSIQENSIRPVQLRDEIPTMNRMGYMKIDLDEFSEEFIEYATGNNDLVLELGCAYGFIVHKVLAKGGKIIANDLSHEHLSILLENTSKQSLENLHLYPGAFPADIELPANSLAAVLTSRMFHFLDGETIEKGLNKIHNWLMPQGKLFFVVCTPYNVAYRDRFLETYQTRVLNKDRWPGVIENHWEINPAHKDYVGSYLHVFDIPQLENLLPQHGFKIEKIKLFDYPKDFDSDGKGHVGFVASKV
jgi:SAM-dependent methyltransferase